MTDTGPSELVERMLTNDCCTLADDGDIDAAAEALTAALDRAEAAEAACAEWAEVSQTNYQRAKTAEARAEELDALLNRAAKALASVKEEDGDGFVMGSDWHDETRAILALIAKDTE